MYELRGLRRSHKADLGFLWELRQRRSWLCCSAGHYRNLLIHELRGSRRSYKTDSARAVVLVRLLFHVAGTQRKVDGLFDARALIVLDVDATRQLHERVIEGLRLLFQTNVVLDIPEPLIDRLQFGTQGRDVLRRGRMRCPGAVQRVQLIAHIGQLCRIAHALGLDLQDGDLVQQLTEGHGDEDF